MGQDRFAVAVYRRLPRAWQVRAVRLATPNYTLGTVALLTKTGGELLLVRQSYRTGWLPPGGLLGRRETPAQCLRRELIEELDLRVELGTEHRVAFDLARQAVSYVFVARLPEGSTPVPCSPEILEARWFPLDALPPLCSDFHEGVTADDLQAVRDAGS